MLQNGLSIVGGERFVRAGSHADAARVHAAVEDHNDVRAERLNLRLHLLAGALSDRDRADDRADADDDSEHRQDRPEFVARQGPQRYANYFSRIHDANLI